MIYTVSVAFVQCQLTDLLGAAVLASPSVHQVLLFQLLLFESFHARVPTILGVFSAPSLLVVFVSPVCSVSMCLIYSKGDTLTNNSSCFFAFIDSSCSFFTLSFSIFSLVRNPSTCLNDGSFDSADKQEDMNGDVLRCDFMVVGMWDGSVVG
jgi:hypothetical protein